MAIFLALTHTRNHREMKAAKARLLAGGTFLEADHGEIEVGEPSENSNSCNIVLA